MAYTEIGTLSPLAVKRWSQQLMRESFNKMSITSLFGKGPEACIQVLGDLEKNAGDTIVFDLMNQDRSPGVNGDSKLDGFEAPITYFQDTLKINQKRHAHAFLGMSQQRTIHDLRSDGKVSLSQWWAWFMEGSLFAHLAGIQPDVGETGILAALGANTAGTDFAGNTVGVGGVYIDTNHDVNGTASTFTPTLIDTAVARAKVLNPRVAPIMVNGQPKYVMYLHPDSVRSMRAAAATSAINVTWNSIFRDAGPRTMENPIFTGALGEYNGVILRESEFVPRVGSTVYNVLLGQGAGAIAFGNAWRKSKRSAVEGGGAHFDWREKTADYENEEGVAGCSVLGFKRSHFNNQAYGVMVVRSNDPVS